MCRKPSKRRYRPWIFRFIQIAAWFPALTAMIMLVELVVSGNSSTTAHTLVAFKIIVLLAIFTSFILILDYIAELEEAMPEDVSDAGSLETDEVILPDVSDLDALVALYRKCGDCDERKECIPGTPIGPEECKNSDAIGELEELMKSKKVLEVK